MNKLMVFFFLIKKEVARSSRLDMGSESPPPYQELSGSSEKLFSVGHHSRNSSLTSLAGDEACVELLPGGSGPLKPGKEASNYSKGDDQGRRRCKVTGSCMCKLSVVFYLAGCILISALYVAFFGKNQAFFGDAWIPGKVRW
jgi:hypothetical protein